ncbi:MAG: MaoC family dehydratase [Candidatus Tectomicrobia bacterium]|nr:MaoC family dehydratase [Candidatus Tectomicrobia bacterium]
MGGRYLEDFRAGDVYKHTPGRTITENDNAWFTLLTMNTHPLHFDQNYASKTEFGRCLVNGTLVFSIAVGMSVSDVSERCIANLDYEFITHHAPVFNGDTLYSESEVLEVRESKSKPDRGVVYVETRAYNQKGEKVLSFRRHVLIPKRASKAVPEQWGGP